MNSEIKSLIKVWITVLASLSYCYFFSKKIPKGFLRLLSVLPIIPIFTMLPLSLSSINLLGIIGFFIGWLANFKLLLFSFDQGPLSSNPPLSFKHFISIACFPVMIKSKNKQNPSSQIKIKQNPSPQNSSNNHENPSISSTSSTQIKPKSLLNYAIKGLLLVLLIRVYDYKPYLNPNFILLLYCFHIYLNLDILLALVSAMVRFFLGLELEPQFDSPFISTSLQDFWGRRWNLMVTGILRPTVYQPVRSICTRIFGRRWAQLVALLATFAVSGLMHELIFFYFGRVWPTWEVMSFFVLHGICLAVEIEVKRCFNGRWQLHRFVTGPLTVGFVLVTGFRLFFPQYLRCGADVRAIREYAIIGEFVKGVVSNIWVSVGGKIDTVSA
ncbi:hypothetical protein BVC80_1287g29 [Macleaya cordata]|uniref:Wax synthase domain-containing protein n=1 Tax=Macleaya cordata TaxID=56857 RepID=A0A200Q878_MACCD|nr:hypothetical protein BVC80_1287g29 [Macleaya cordata]